MKKIDKYQIFAEIHKGPVTTLYKAFHLQLERTVLIKQLNAERLGDEEIQDRFQQEGLITAKINHPNVIGIYDYSDRDDSPFIVMEFIEGISLADVIRDHSPLPLDIAIAVMHSMCLGIQALHKKNFLHRDIKPANTLISDEGQVKIGDFGFAGSQSEWDDQILGTPEYMAPEYVLSQEIGEQSDIFSLGVVFYELLTGENPFRAGSTEACFKKIVNFQPLSIDKIRPELPGELVNLCEAMLEKAQAKRPASVDEVIEILAPYPGRVRDDAIAVFLSQPEQYESSALVAETVDTAPARQIETRRSHIGRIVFISIAVVALLIFIFRVVIPKMSADHTDQIAATNPAMKDSVQSEQKIAAQTEAVDTLVHASSEEQFAGDMTAIEQNNESPMPEINSEPEIESETEPAQPFEIEINTDPRAWLIIEKDTIGIAPVSYRIETAPAILNMKIRNPGFPEIRKKIEIADRTDQKFDISLWDEVGYLKVAVNPWGQVWIDGDSVDVTPRAHPIILSRGQHVLEIRHPALKTVNENIYITSGDTLEKSYRLMEVR